MYINFLILFLLIINSCFAERFIRSTKYDYQDEVLVKGASIIVSNKVNQVLMYQTSETLNDYRGNFFFTLSNNTATPINFCFSDLRITDQWGRHVQIAHKNELIAAKQSERNWNIFASLICLGADSIDAQKAGTINYESQTVGSYNANYTAYGANNYVNGTMRGNSISTTNGTIYSEALHQQAVRRAQEDARYRNESIQASYNNWEYGLNNFYFDSTTIFSGTSYSANFQIILDKKIEKDLQYLIFTYNVGGEQHTFCYYCGEVKKKWYHF